MVLSTDVAEILLKYGESRLDTLKAKLGNDSECLLAYKFEHRKRPYEPLFVNRKSFSAQWKAIRQQNPMLKNLTHTKFRHFIETMVNFAVTVLK